MSDDDNVTIYEDPVAQSPNLTVQEDVESNLVSHARRELELIGEDPDTIAWYLHVVQAFADFGHSGGSAAATLPVLNQLLQYKNLTQITSNPSEWEQVAVGLWQARRNSEMFSNDGGQTHYLLSEGANDSNPFPTHTTELDNG